MLWLQHIALTGFKNIPEAGLRLSRHINCFAGKNGSGKTNLLDAVYFLSFTKSFFNAQDGLNIRHGEVQMSVEGQYERNGLKEKVRLYYKQGDKKLLKVNNNEVRKFSDHIGQYPLVIITPNDIMLIHDGSEDRRKFLDGMIAQTDKAYLNDLLSYNRTLEQRNKQLRQFGEAQLLDPELLESYNELLARFGDRIHEKRQQFLNGFVPVFCTYYQQISSSQEPVNLIYESNLNSQPMQNLLNQYTSADLAAQRTTKGIHKDDLEFEIAGYPLKKYGSQGQQKSFIIALKLAQYAFLKEKTGIPPLLLLDDIFEKLDGERLRKLLQMISDDAFGQLFITDTHLERLQEVFGNETAGRVHYFTVNEGIINEL